MRPLLSSAVALVGAGALTAAAYALTVAVPDGPVKAPPAGPDGIRQIADEPAVPPVREGAVPQTQPRKTPTVLAAEASAALEAATAAVNAGNKDDALAQIKKAQDAVAQMQKTEALRQRLRENMQYKSLDAPREQPNVAPKVKEFKTLPPERAD